MNIALLALVLLGAPKAVPAPASTEAVCPSRFAPRECQLWSLLQRYRALTRERTEERDAGRARERELKLDLTAVEGRERALAARVDVLGMPTADSSSRFRTSEVMGVGLVMAGLATALTGWLGCGDERRGCQVTTGASGALVVSAGVVALLVL